MMSGWKLALHTWTIDTTPFDIALDVSRATGFDAIELRRSDLVQCFRRGRSRASIIDAILRNSLPVGILGTEYGWFFTTGDEQLRMFEVLRETCEIAREVGCDMIMSAPGQFTGTVEQAIEATKIAGDIVGSYGLRLALEFNSQHPLVNRTGILREIIDGADNDHCGMLLDSYHLYRSQGISRGLDGVRGEELFVFQYSDVPENPETGVRRPVDRLAPGEGVLDWKELFSILDAIGYRGYLSYEAPNPAAWARSPYDVAREGLDRTRTLLAQAGMAQ